MSVVNRTRVYLCMSSAFFKIEPRCTRYIFNDEYRLLGQMNSAKVKWERLFVACSVLIV